MSADRLRLFYTDSSLISGDEALITGEEAAHLARALRMKPGEPCRLATEAGEEFIAELTAVSSKEASAKIIERLGKRPPPPLSIALGLPLIKGERFEWALEKTTELGVSAFRPLALSRCEVKIPANKTDSRTSRWERIVRESAKQCGRIPPPRVFGPAPLDDFLAATEGADLKLIAWLGEGRRGAAEVMREAAGKRAEGAQMSAALILGPEGDLTPEEVSAACAAGFIPVDMGPRVLRADTAPIALVTMIQATLGDMA